MPRKICSYEDKTYRMKRIILAFSVCCLSMAMSAGSVNYTADNTTIFSNPERGFITMIGGNLSSSNPYGVKGQESTLDYHISRDGISIVLVHYYLDKYKSTAAIPEKVLNAFDEDMQVLRNYGMKAIVRFSYVDNVSNETANDAPWSISQQHIAQYKSHWQANADVIFCFQAGIVGAWGEWYYTKNYGNKVDTMNAARRQVVDAMLDAVPADRCIQLRTPLFKTTYMHDTYPLTGTTAYKGDARARLAHHNDAFLTGWDDMGTYVDTATQKPYLAQETLYVPIGGESCIDSESTAKKNASYAKTTAEMSRMHWTFIQNGFSEKVTGLWRENGTFDELNRKLGYRYQLVSGSYSDEVPQGGQLVVNMQIKNVGYAPLYNERPAYIVLKGNNRTYSLRLQADPRRWLPNGVVSTVSEQVALPYDIPTGTYRLYLHLPDAYSSLASDPRYAVRFANTGVWDAATGLNDLNVTVQVTAAQGLETVDRDQQNERMYDLLGRPVNEHFTGVVIRHESKTLQVTK